MVRVVEVARDLLAITIKKQEVSYMGRISLIKRGVWCIKYIMGLYSYLIYFNGYD